MAGVAAHADAFAPAPGMGAAHGGAFPPVGHPARYLSGMYRHSEEYSGYTLRHLPVISLLLPSAVAAIPAILAARIAFSSFISRSLARYGPRERKSDC